MVPVRFALKLKLFLVLAFRINLFLNTINAVVYVLCALRKAQVKAAQLTQVGAQARLQSLKEQVNPHFLFNNLNVLSSLVYQDADQVAEFIQQLARVYRYVLQQQEKDMVELGTELDFLSSYLFVLRTRFRGSLLVRVEVSEARQMLVENALKHNINSLRRPLHIEVFAEEEGGWLVVRNNRQPRLVPEPSLQVGLRNIVAHYGFVSERAVHKLRQLSSPPGPPAGGPAPDLTHLLVYSSSCVRATSRALWCAGTAGCSSAPPPKWRISVPRATPSAR